MSASALKIKKAECTHKKTDFRHQLWVKNRKLLKERAKSKSFHVQTGPTPKSGSRSTVSVDTAKAKSTVDVLRLCLQELHWREYPFGKRDGGHCDIYWNAVHFDDNPDIPGGKVNKFPGMVEVLRKVNLGRSLDVMKQLYPEEYDFHPQSWCLPKQYPEFINAHRRMTKKHLKPYFIVKPDMGSQGEGIYLIREPLEYMFNDRTHIIQEYIDQPLLIDGLKFDFRLYVLLTSVDPLTVYLCKEGLARFCTIAYQKPTGKNIHETYMHLTNYSLNKRSSTYVHTESQNDGSKRTISSVFKTLKKKGINTSQIWEDIKVTILKTMLAICPELMVEYRATVTPVKDAPSCFQILGFDILLKENGKPVLLEVNANPSLRIDFEQEVAPGIGEYIHSPVDEEIKRPLVMDTLLLVAPRYKRLPPRSQRKPRVGLDRQEALRDGEDTSGDPDDDLEDLRRTSLHRGYDTLEQIYPGNCEELFSHLRILEHAATIFQQCMGVKRSVRLGATGFRTFTRKCRLTGNGFTNATFDILYIDIQKRWEESMNSSPTKHLGGGVCYQGYIEALFTIARKRSPEVSILEAVKSLLEHCSSSLEQQHESSGPALPQLSRQDQKMEQLKSLYGGSNRKKLGNSLCVDYKKSPSDKTKTVKSAVLKSNQTELSPSPSTKSASTKSDRSSRSPETSKAQVVATKSDN